LLLPLLLQLKHPLLVELMGCFAALLKEYKSEVEDILVADKQVSARLLCVHSTSCSLKGLTSASIANEDDK
jgi:hypothetical protein